jgi:hypothetical protein
LIYFLRGAIGYGDWIGDHGLIFFEWRSQVIVDLKGDRCLANA